MFIAPHSRVNPVKSWGSRCESGTGEQGYLRRSQFQSLHWMILVKNAWGSPVTKMDSLGYDCPLSHPAPGPTTPSSLHQCHGTELQRCSEQHREQCSRASAFPYPAGRHLFGQKAGFVPSCTERSTISYFSPHLPTPAPKSLGCTICMHISHSLLFPECLLLPSPISIEKMFH